MTVIAWDGETLAADRQATSGGVKFRTRKIEKIRGHLVGYCGNSALGRARKEWFRDGALVDKYPPDDKQNNIETWLIVITPKKEIHVYEHLPYPIDFYGKFYANGSGREFALAAMHLGMDAREAVRLASQYDTSCGLGIDTLTLEGK